MDYKELYFGLYAEINGVIEMLEEILKKYEELFCSGNDQTPLLKEE